MTRLLGVVSVALVLAPAALGAPTVRLAGADTSGYPQIVVTAITSTPTAAVPRVAEDGRPASGVKAVNLGAAKSIVLAIDNSQSMGGTPIVDAAAAARRFVDAKTGTDRVSVMSFGHDPLQLTGFSTSAIQADGVLRGLQVDRQSGTALYDAVVAAARSLRGSDEPGRVIVVLTDGHDVSSSSSLDAAVRAARAAGASVYAIGIEGADFDPLALRTLARETGGTYHGAGSSAELGDVYASIGSELERTWRITYPTAARPGDRVAVRIAMPGGGSAEHTLAIPSDSGAAAAPSPSPLLPPAAFSLIGTLGLAIAAGLFVLLAALQLVRMRRGSWVQQRLAPHVAHTAQRGVTREERLSFLKALFAATEGAFGRRRQWHAIQRMLVRGDVPLRPAEFLWLIVGSAAGLGIVFAVLGGSPVVVLVAFAVGGATPYAVVAHRVRRRSKAFEEQLPDLLTTIAASLKAGHSFKHGLQAVVDEAQPPASIELKRVLTEAGLGRPLDDALADMADRIGSENFAFAITAVTIQRQVGGSLAALFDMVAETVRNRQQFARKIKSLTAMGRMSAYTLIGIPFFIGGMISLMNPDYMAPLFHTGLGHVLLFGGLGMMGVGSMILKKIVSFKG